MSKVLVEFCGCTEFHSPECQLYKRLKLKYALIDKYDIKGNYVPEWLEKMVDEKMSANRKNNIETVN